MNGQRKKLDVNEERMQTANDACWKDDLSYKGNHISSKIKCQRLVDDVFAVFSI